MKSSNKTIHIDLIKKDCIFFSTADWRTPYWTNKQHMAKLMANNGWRILYIESIGLRKPKISSSRDWKRFIFRLSSGLNQLIFGPVLVDKNIWVFSPLVIPLFQDISLIKILNLFLIKIVQKKFIKKNNFINPLIWTYHPFFDLKSVINDGLKVVYHCVDDLAAMPGINATSYQRKEKELLISCHLVFTTSITLQARCFKFNKKTFYLPNVVDYDHFSQVISDELIPPEVKNIPRPRMVYHGSLSSFKINFELLESVFRNQPNWHLLLIGDEPEGQNDSNLNKLINLENVHLLGYRPYNELPRYIRFCDLGLIPALKNDYTNSMFPMKFYEYLASGLRIVSTNISFSQNTHMYLLSSTGNRGFRDAIVSQLRKGKLEKKYSKIAVGDNTWFGRYKKMIKILTTHYIL